MAKVDIQYSCGCGFLTHNLEAAGTHCDTKFHDMTISGIIKSSTRTSIHQATPAGYKPITKDKHGDKVYSSPVRVIEPTPEVVTQKITADFNSLRAKLGKKT
jgi:hypothetical protein